MDNLKNDKYYLDKIITDLKFIIDNTAEKSQEDIENDALLMDSIMFRIIQIAENTIRLSEEFKSRNSDIPWLSIRGMRNRIVHDYGMINTDVVYDTVINGIPKTYEKLMKIK